MGLSNGRRKEVLGTVGDGELLAGGDVSQRMDLCRRAATRQLWCINSRQARRRTHPPLGSPR